MGSSDALFNFLEVSQCGVRGFLEQGLDAGYCEFLPRDIGISGYGIFEGGQWWESGGGMVVSEEGAHGSYGVAICSCVWCCQDRSVCGGPCRNWA